MKFLAKTEELPIEEIRARIANGEVLINCGSGLRTCRPVGIQKGLRTKINANVGTSSDLYNMTLEVEKANCAPQTGHHGYVSLTHPSHARDGERTRRSEETDYYLAEIVDGQQQCRR